MILNNIIKDQLNGIAPVPGKTGVDWYFFCYFLESLCNTNMLEIGAGAGGSTISMLSYAKSVTVIDSWEPGWPKQPVQTLVDRYKLPVKWIDKQSAKVNQTELEKYTFTHLDANKDYCAILYDLELASTVTTDIICVDDYLQSTWPEVTWAVDKWIAHSKWKRILIGNHQVFLSCKKLLIKEIVANWPVIDRGYGYHLNYGKFPDELMVNQFIKSGDMKYSWHNHQQLQK
mgnify:CR=1 FL=1